MENPLKYRLPCIGCDWLKTSEDRPAGHKYRCGFPVEEIAVPYGFEVRPTVGHLRRGVTMTAKEIEGPIAEDARQIECACQKGGA